MRSTLLSLILLLIYIISTNANNNDCGTIKIKSSIQLSFNGTSAIPGLFPWLAPLFHSEKGYVCGSSIITKNHLLTAAHCVISKAKDYHALFGRFDLSNDSEVNWTNRNMSKVYVHDEFNISAKTLRSNADIAIFAFLLEIQYNDYVQPICLPDQSASTIHINGIVAGYGKTNIYGNYQNTPSYVLLKSTDIWSCLSKDIRYGNIVSERSFCAGSQTSVPCQGDSGGGYYSQNQISRKFTIYGIVSFAIGLCNPQDYVAFADVPKFIPWINEKINENIGSTSDPCELTDCGMYSECRVINERASCRCMPGFLGFPPYCDIACSTNSECSTSRSCFRGICTNLCLGSGICVENAECSMQTHRPVCKCKDGFIGDGYRKCEIDENKLENSHKNTYDNVNVRDEIDDSKSTTALSSDVLGKDCRLSTEKNVTQNFNLDIYLVSYNEHEITMKICGKFIPDALWEQNTKCDGNIRRKSVTIIEIQAPSGYIVDRNNNLYQQQLRNFLKIVISEEGDKASIYFKTIITTEVCPTLKFIKSSAGDNGVKKFAEIYNYYEYDKYRARILYSIECDTQNGLQ